MPVAAWFTSWRAASSAVTRAVSSAVVCAVVSWVDASLNDVRDAASRSGAPDRSPIASPTSTLARWISRNRPTSSIWGALRLIGNSLPPGELWNAGVV